MSMTGKSPWFHYLAPACKEDFHGFGVAGGELGAGVVGALIPDDSLDVELLDGMDDGIPGTAGASALFAVLFEFL